MKDINFSFLNNFVLKFWFPPPCIQDYSCEGATGLLPSAQQREPGQMCSVLAAVSTTTERWRLGGARVCEQGQERHYEECLQKDIRTGKYREHPFSLCPNPTLNEFYALQSTLVVLGFFFIQATDNILVPQLCWEYHALSFSPPRPHPDLFGGGFFVCLFAFFSFLAWEVYHIWDIDFWHHEKQKKTLKVWLEAQNSKS